MKSYTVPVFALSLGIAVLLWVLLIDTWRPGLLPLGLATAAAALLIGAGVLLAILVAVRQDGGGASARWRLALVGTGGAVFLAIAGFAFLQQRHRTPSPLQFVRMREHRPFGPGEISRGADGAVEIRTVHGIEVSIERSAYDLDVLPSEAQLHAAHDLLRRTREQAPQFSDYDRVKSDLGFTVSTSVLGDDEGSVLEHLINPANLLDTEVLDPAHPEALVFRNEADGRRSLVGFMYMARRGSHGPQVGGPLTRWHFHPETFFCMDSVGVPRARMEARGGCPSGLNNGPSSEMMHVWLVENTHGVFSHMMGAGGLDGSPNAAGHGDHR